MTSVTNIEASILRYLYENLEVPHGIKIFEDLVSVNFDAEGEWVVIDSLSNTLGPVPVQHYMLHIAQQRGAPNAKERLIRLVDRVVSLFELWQEIPLYDLDQGAEVGTISVTKSSLAPVLQHKGGGSMRSLNITVAYPG